MRAQKIIMGVMLGSMMLGMVVPIVASIAQPSSIRSGDPASVEQMKRALESTIAAAEQAVGGHATAVRLDRSGAQPRWIVGVAAPGGTYQVTVERGGGKITTTVVKSGVATPATSPANATGGRS